MASPILFKVEDAVVDLLQADATVAGLMVQNADGSESPIVILPGITAAGLDDSRITVEATEASSQLDRVRSGNFSVTINVHVVTGIPEHSVPVDGADADGDGESDAPALSIDFGALRERHGNRAAAVVAALRTDTLPADLSALATGFGIYGHQFNGERARVEGNFFIYTVSFVLVGVCETDI